MTLIESPIQSEIHLVEVSGWDENEMFFVETCDLDWDDFAGKHISLQHMLPEGAMVFFASSSLWVPAHSAKRIRRGIPRL
jgi:hypothetical protein